jgi:hypothetical protein
MSLTGIAETQSPKRPSELMSQIPMEGFSRKVVSGLRRTGKVERYRDLDKKDASCLLGTDNYRLLKGIYAGRNLVSRLTGASHPWKIMEWGQSLVADSPNRDWLPAASFAVQGNNNLH